MDQDSAYRLIRYCVLLVTFASIAIGIRARAKLVGEHRELFDWVMACMGLFSAGIIVHSIRDDLWDIEPLRVLESMLFLFGFICTLFTALHVIKHKDEWGIESV